MLSVGQLEKRQEHWAFGARESPEPRGTWQSRSLGLRLVKSQACDDRVLPVAL